jgi:uncharacterized protein (TIGR02266 family)
LHTEATDMLPDRSFSELFDEADPVTQTRAKTATTERRTAVRAALEADVVVATDAQFFSGIASDLSAGGIFIATTRILDVGTAVTLEFALPDGQVLARGVVRWVRRGGEGEVPGMGVVFDELAAIDSELVAKFCSAGPRFYTYDEIKAVSGSN